MKKKTQKEKFEDLALSMPVLSYFQQTEKKDP
jgi:hypothetical protein